MKKSLMKAGIAIMIAAVSLTACEKNDNEVAAPKSAQKISIQEMFSHPEVAEAYQQIQANWTAKHGTEKAEFITPFFTNDGFGILKNLVLDFSGPFPVIVGGEFANFSDDFDGNDWWRSNNNGNVSVHMNSNTADAYYENIGTGETASADDAHVAVKYDGPVIHLEFYDENGNLIFAVDFIDNFQNASAVSMHGNARVNDNITGAAHSLIGTVRWTPGGGQGKIDFSYN